jgi:hypothetical protein
MAQPHEFGLFDKNDPASKALYDRLNAEALAKAEIFELARQNNAHYPNEQIRNAELQSLIDHLDRNVGLMGLEDLASQMQASASKNQPFALNFWSSL